MFKLSNLFAFALLQVSTLIFGQENYRALHWGVNEGLSQAENYRFLKDYYGFIWVNSKEGLNRFDGNTFKRYYASGDSKYGLISDETRNGMVEDSMHNIWIGSAAGISRFDIRADTFTHFRLPKDSVTGIQNGNPFWATHNEVICVESEISIVAYDIRSLHKRVLGKFATGDNVAIGPSLSYAYFDSTRNTIWTLAGEIPGKPTALLELNLSSGSKTRHAMPYLRSSTNNDHTAEAMKFDRLRNSIWINTRDGLWKFSLATMEFSQPEILRSLVMQKGYDRFVGIDEDTQGRIWFATSPMGILIFDPEKNTVTTPFPRDQWSQTQISDYNACIYADRDGIIWIGRWAQVGIDALLPFSRSITWYHSFPKTAGFNEYMIGPTYLGKNKMLVSGFASSSLVELNTRSDEMRMIQTKDLNMPGSKKAPFFAVPGADTLASKAWIVTDGYYEWNLHNNSCKKILFLDNQKQLITVNPGITIPFRTGIATFAGVGSGQRIFLINSNEPVGHQIINLEELKFDGYHSTSDGNNTIFILGLSHEENRVYREQNNQWILLKGVLNNIGWTGIAFSRFDSSYWIADKRTLYHYTYDFRLIGKLGAENGVPEQAAGGLRIDNRGDLWFHTDRAIFRLNTRSGSVYMLSKSDGFEQQTFETMQFTSTDADGDIYFAGGVFGKGFNRIRPGNPIGSPAVPVYIRNLKINNEKEGLSEGANNLNEINLKYFQNTIRIETGIIDHHSEGKTSIRYKLAGDSSWQYGPYYATIRYDGLSPGDYQLIVQANNIAGNFNGPQRILEIHIKPAFWQTSWFRILAVLVLIGSMVAIIQYRSRNLKRRNLALESKVASRTQELKTSLEDLKETQTQLIQREKMASLGELTAGIAHEIQNPLNFVKNFSEINREIIAELKDELKKGNLGEAASLIEGLDQNESKIIHHGQRADSIVKGMLQHSRNSTGVKEPTDINALADEYLRLSYHGLRAKDKSFNADIETRFDPGLGEVSVIPQDIGRVLLNIYNNAFYAVHEKQKQLGDSFKPNVSVTTQFIPASNGSTPKTEIRIRDNGMGIPQKVLDKIFQPFFTTKPTGEGTGLGLSLSYDIITKTHAGALKVESRDGEGAEFMIILPAT